MLRLSQLDYYLPLLLEDFGCECLAQIIRDPS